MELDRIVRELVQERRLLEEAIAALEGLMGAEKSVAGKAAAKASGPKTLAAGFRAE